MDTAPTAEQVEEKVKATVEEEKKRLGLETDKNFPDPCSFLSEADVRSIAGVPAETEVKVTPGRVAKNLCSYSWDKPNAEAIRKKNAEAQREAVMAAIKNKGRRKEAISSSLMDAVRKGELSTGTVSVSVPQFEIKDAAQAKKIYETAINRMAKGVSRTAKTKLGDHKITFQRNYEPVAGVGDAASWSEKSSQIAIRSGNKVLYIDVRVESDSTQNFKIAKRLALEALD